jgi:hypothetical protein
MPPRLFLDLDGVLADFDRAVLAVTGLRPDQQSVPAMWRALAHHADFFATLPMLPDAPALWDFCRPHRPVILTGLPLGNWAAPQKRRWVAAHLGNDVDVITCMARDKVLHSGPGHVLVDDRAAAAGPWQTAGGVFVLHTTAAATIATLESLGFP